MMDDDEKTVRGGHGPLRTQGPKVVRTTAPVGTPVDPAAPQRIPSDRPMSALTPPRTVGGHTARLNVPDGEAAPAGPGPAAGAPADVAPRAVGGTMRMAPAPTLNDPNLMAVPVGAAPAAASPVVAAPAASPSIPVTVSAPPQQPTATTKPAVPAAVAGGEGLTVSPLAVSVGLVFFAVGSMIALAADGRFGGRGREGAAAHSAEPAVTVSAAPAPPPKPSAVPIATAVVSATPSAPTAAAVVPPVPSPPRTPPPPPPPPPGTRPKQPPRPGLPF